MEKTELINYYTGCKIIFSHYGEEHQRKQLCQECGELIVAVTKGDLENVIEEMADVLVVIDQFRIDNPKINKKLDLIMMSKVNRQLERMKKCAEARKGKN